MTFKEQLAEIRLRKAAILRGTRHARVIAFYIDDRLMRAIHRGTDGQWRCTSFDEEGPAGHLCYRNFAEAIKANYFIPSACRVEIRP